jgi:hypothetical protein
MAESGKSKGRRRSRGLRKIEGYEQYDSFRDDPELREQRLGEWFEVDLGALFADAPFKLYAAKFKSSTRECEEFIHFPLESMMRSGVPGVTESSRIVTLLPNHQWGLARWPMFAMATVSDDGDVEMTVQKVEPAE